MLLCLLSFLVHFALGLLYPIYSSLKLITKDQKEVPLPEVQRWVTYWILYSVLGSLCCCNHSEYEFLETIVTLFKMGVVVALALPYTGVCNMVYDRLFKNMEETKQKIRDAVKGAMEKCCSCCSGKKEEPCVK